MIVNLTTDEFKLVQEALKRRASQCAARMNECEGQALRVWTDKMMELRHIIEKLQNTKEEGDKNGN